MVLWHYLLSASLFPSCFDYFHLCSVAEIEMSFVSYTFFHLEEYVWIHYSLAKICQCTSRMKRSNNRSPRQVASLIWCRSRCTGIPAYRRIHWSYAFCNFRLVIGGPYKLLGKSIQQYRELNTIDWTLHFTIRPTPTFDLCLRLLTALGFMQPPNRCILDNRNSDHTKSGNPKDESIPAHKEGKERRVLSFRGTYLDGQCGSRISFNSIPRRQYS